MTLLWADGFDTYGNTNNTAPSPSGIIDRKYQGGASGTASFRIRAGRISGNSIALSTSTTFCRTTNLNTSNTFIVGGAYKFASPGGNNFSYDLWRARDHSSSEFLIARMQYGEIELLTGGVSQVRTTNLHLKLNTWYYIEFKIFIDGSAGTCIIRLNGIEVSNATGLDTQTNSPASVMDFRLIGSVNLGFEVDDFYIADDSGSVNNDFLGSIEVHTIRPNGDDTANFTTSTPSANHFENVDEVVTDDNTSYVESNTSGHRELYDYGSISGFTTIRGVGLNVDLNDGGANQNFQHLLKSNTTENSSGNVTINSSTYKTYLYISEQDPDANANWTQTTINAAKFGFQIP